MSKEVQEPIAHYGKVYTYADYLKWNIEERIEILKGKIFKMAAAPSRKHQEVLSELHFIFKSYFNPKPCRVYLAPFDVRLVNKDKKSKKDEDIITVFQPDLCVICDKEKLDKRGCIGAPDLIIEILSPSNSKREMNQKFKLYEENGVREYWMVDYVSETILMYVLENGVYRGLKPFTTEESVSSYIFPELSFEVKEIFEE